jgi:hypothetical protein
MEGRKSDATKAGVEIKRSMILGGCVGFGLAVGYVVGNLAFRESASNTWWPNIVGGLVCIVVTVITYQIIQAWNRE